MHAARRHLGVHEMKTDKPRAGTAAEDSARPDVVAPFPHFRLELLTRRRRCRHGVPPDRECAECREPDPPEAA